MPYTVISDEPCNDLSLLPLRAKICQQMSEAIAWSEAPLVVGVHGDWGSGKTSFLRRLATVIEQHPSCVAIWFEAWRYQGETTPIIALLHEVRGQLTYKEHLLQRIKNDAAYYGGIAVESLFEVFDGAIGRLTDGLIASTGAISKTGERREGASLRTPLSTAVLRKYLEKALQDLLPREEVNLPSPRLVIFIDDLDRCEPEVTFRLLEALKVYLSLPNCVFVLGLNQREVERALRRVLPASGDGPHDSAAARAHEYLEKICSNIWHLPLPVIEDQRNLLNHWLKTKVPESLLTTTLQLLDEFHFLPANPRRLKAFANQLIRLAPAWAAIHSENLLREAERETEPDTPSINYVTASTVCIIASLQQFHPRLWRHIEDDHAFYEMLRTHVAGTDVKASPPKDAERDDRHRHPSLDDLSLPFWPAAKEGPKPTYADRSYGHVLHSQRLIAQCFLTPAEIGRWLVAAPIR